VYAVVIKALAELNWYPYFPINLKENKRKYLHFLLFCDMLSNRDREEGVK